MLPDIDSIALFVRTADLHSLTKAADASSMGVAAASRRIALLENRLNVVLFERSSRGVALTAAGASLLEPARLLLLQLNQMQNDMADHSAGRKGVLRLSANTSAITQFLPEDVAEFEQSNPDIRLVIHESWSSNIVQALLASEVDVGIVMDGSATDGLSCFPYRADRLALIFPPGHPLQQRPSLAFHEVLEHDIIGLEDSASMMMLLAEEARRHQKVLKLRVQVRSFEAVSRMVQAGLGIGVLPGQVATTFGEGLGLAVRPLDEPWAVRRMLVCIRAGRAIDSSLQKLLDALCTF